MYTNLIVSLYFGLIVGDVAKLLTKNIIQLSYRVLFYEKCF